ncbi:TPA: hypothetical protein SMP92_000395 [Pseudomonas putida]|nr:hypothetical protein [Pseudomonas putida]
MFKDFTHHAYQAAFFTDKAEIPADEFNVACRKKLKIGNINPSFVPEFPGMPDEIPRLQVQSDAGYTITLSRVRVDVILDRAFGLGAEDKAVFFSNIAAVADILSEYGFKVSRVGLVKRFYKVMGNPQRFVSDLFGGHGGQNLVDFTVNGVLRVDVMGRSCNDIYNISAGIIRGVEPGVVTFRDLTVVPGGEGFTIGEAKEFLLAADEVVSLESMTSFVGGV